MATNVLIGGNDPTLASLLGTVGTSPVPIVAAAASNYANNIRHYLYIHNPSATASLAYTVDGSAPAVNGNGFTIAPLGAKEWTDKVPQGAITIIASGSSSPYSILVG